MFTFGQLNVLYIFASVKPLKGRRTCSWCRFLYEHLRCEHGRVCRHENGRTRSYYELGYIFYSLCTWASITSLYTDPKPTDKPCALLDPSQINCKLNKRSTFLELPFGVPDFTCTPTAAAAQTLVSAHYISIQAGCQSVNSECRKKLFNPVRETVQQLSSDITKSCPPLPGLT